MIPEDVINIILDELPDDDWKTFSLCSTIACSFTIPCQSRLFQRVYISPFQQRCAKLLELLTQSPHIGNYIRVLFLESEWLLAGGPLPESANWIYDEPTLPSILDMLPSLRALHLCPQYQAPLNWQDFSPNLKASLLRQLCSPNLKKVELDLLRIPVEVLYSTQVEELRLFESSVVSSQEAGPKVDSGKRHLKSLCITASTQTPPIIDALSPVFQLEHLQELILNDAEDMAFDALSALMELCASSLRKFRWTVPAIPEKWREYNGEYNREPAGFTIPPGLLSLEVGEIQFANSYERLNPIDWAIRALKILVEEGNPVSLEEATFGMICDYIGPMGMEYLIDYRTWQEIDERLSNEEIFPNLKRVTIFIRGGFDEEDIGIYFMDTMPHRMPGVYARGILDASTTMNRFADEKDNYDYITGRAHASIAF